jgi:hypothetical protein
MKIISGIFFAVIFGLVGARFAGPAVDWLIGTQVFESPDQVAKFDLFARLGVTVAIALIGLFVGLIVAAGLRRRLIRSES